MISCRVGRRGIIYKVAKSHEDCSANCSLSVQTERSKIVNRWDKHLPKARKIVYRNFPRGDSLKWNKSDVPLLSFLFLRWQHNCSATTSTDCTRQGGTKMIYCCYPWKSTLASRCARPACTALQLTFNPSVPIALLSIMSHWLSVGVRMLHWLQFPPSQEHD